MIEGTSRRRSNGAAQPKIASPKADNRATRQPEVASRILILTDDPTDAAGFRQVPRYPACRMFDVEWEGLLSAGLERLREVDFEALVVTLSLPDSVGIATFDKLFAANSHMPIFVLCVDETAGDPLAAEAMRRGAEGAFSRASLESSLVPQMLYNAISRRRSDEELFRERARAGITLNSISDAVLCTDLSGDIDYLNIAAERMTGWSREEAKGHPVAEVFNIVNSLTGEVQPNPVALVLECDKPQGLVADTVLVRRDGSRSAIEDSASPIHDWNGRLCGVVIVFHDVSEAQKMAERMAHLAQHDFLTDLPNRVLLEERIVQALSFSKRQGAMPALLFLDVDGLKKINDSLGHEVGDLLLKSIGRRLLDCVRSTDTVSRQGGDEFVVLLADNKTADDAGLAARRILETLSKSHMVAAHSLDVGASIGLSLYPADGHDADTLIKNADTAMYLAKAAGGNAVRRFGEDMDADAARQREMERELRRALDEGDLLLHYQAKIDLRTGAITGAEALVRWLHAERGLLYPDAIIPAAEVSGLIVPLGRWVLREACGQAVRWTEAGLDLGSIAVNVSALEFRQDDFLESVRSILDETGLEPCRLHLEVTESVLMHSSVGKARTLWDLKEMGVSLALDDFGTGYSSLSYLTQFPVDALKIDRSFVQSILAATDSGVIANAVIGMAEGLSLQVVAEGVETEAQLAFLQARNCQEAQGYLFSRPISAERFEKLLTTGLPLGLDGWKGTQAERRRAAPAETPFLTLE